MMNQELFESSQMGHKEKKVLSLSKKLVKKCSFNRGSDCDKACPVPPEIFRASLRHC